ncbi:hypothetical protein ACWDQO_36240 [Streptomyces sp. NPDC003703]|uniref:hypothetical protein n=1 Tax=Streptomyces sp. NPDC003283 TaxID=3364681 RepID=UPI00368CFF3B
MPFIHEFLLLAVIPLATDIILLVAHLATLRGLRGSQRVEALRILADAVMRRR